MKRRHPIRAFFLLSITTGILAGALSGSATPSTEPPSHPDFELRSFAKIAGSYLFSIHHKPTGRSEWTSPGEQTAGLSILHYDESIRALHVKAEDQTYLLWLQSSAATASQSAVTTVATLVHEPIADHQKALSRLQVTPRGFSTQILTQQDPGKSSPPDNFSASSRLRLDTTLPPQHSTAHSPHPDSQHPDSPAAKTGYRVAPRNVANIDTL